MLSLTTILFITSAFGISSPRRHLIIVFVFLELMLLSVDINSVIASVYLDDPLGQVYVLLVSTIAAAEIATGLATCTVYYRLRGGISSDSTNLLKG